MAEFPDFEPKYSEDNESVRARFDADADTALDKRQGGFYQTLTEPCVSEIVRMWDILNDVLAMTSYLFANGIYLDYKAAEVGLTRKPAAKASGTVRFTGTNGTIVGSGTRTSTTSLTETDVPYRFLTTGSGTISGGYVDLAVQADLAGADSNVAALAIDILEDNISGVASVSNASSMTSGADTESDEDLRTRIGLEIAAPQGAGNKADYIRWARSRDGVGPAVTVVPRWAGINTVKVILLDDTNNPVSQAVMDDVQSYLTGSQTLANPTTTATIAAGIAGALTGTYDYKITFSDAVGETAGSAVTNSVSVTSKKIDLTAIPLGPTGTVSRNIYRRIGGTGKFLLVASIADNVTTTYTDNAAAGTTVLPKTNNTSQFDGIAPVGAIVSVDTADVITINTVATVVFDTGYSLDGTSGTLAARAAIVAAIEEYVNARAPGEDIYYRHVEAQFFKVAGVLDVTGLTVNAGTANIAIASTEVSDNGTVTLT